MTKIILILLLLGGCSARWNSYNYSRDLQKYIGESEMVLYEQWGAPDNVMRISYNDKVVSYTNYYSAPLGGQRQAYAYGLNYGAMNQGFTAQNSNNYYCTTSFTVQDGIVTNYSFNGDDCVAR